jgi:MoaA/NifB/PqqE/SkfB family radical SAM enzyme
MKTSLYKTLTKTLARTLRTPPYVILFLSNSCWMADSIRRIVFLSLTGGEAFARKDVVDITEMFVRKAKLHRYQIPTSGYKPELIISKAEQMLRINRSIPFRVDVSLDGAQTRTLQGTCLGGGCAADSLGGVIYADGEVKACEMLNESLGKLWDFDFDLSAL